MMKRFQPMSSIDKARLYYGYNPLGLCSSMEDENEVDIDNEHTHMEQPSDRLFGGGSCCYPIDDCENCPARPENSDPYWGMTSASIE